MSRASKPRAKTPAKVAATNVADPESAAIETVDAAAIPPGSGVPGGTNTPASESGAAAGSASAETVKPQDKDGTSTPAMMTDATNGQSAPEVEAAASGGQRSHSEPSQGDRDAGAGDTAGLGEQPAWMMSREQFAAAYPLTLALLEGFTGTGSLENPPVLRVTAKQEGFRRAGLVHSRRPQAFPLPTDLTPAQVEALLADPMLTVEVV